MRQHRGLLFGLCALLFLLPSCDEAADCPKCGEQGLCVDSGPAKEASVPDTGAGKEAGSPDAGQLEGWAISGGTDGEDHSHAMVMDSSGNLVVVGKINKGTGAGKFGSFTINGAGGDDIFLARISTAGQVTDVTLNGTKDNEALEAVTADKSGNLILGGYLTGSATFSSKTLKSNGFSDFLVSRLNNSGTYDWAMSGGSVTNSDYTKALATDASGNVYVGGTYADSMTFNGKTYTHNKGQKHAFMLKLDNTGKVVWFTPFTGTILQSVGGVVVDSSGNIYMAGSFKGTLGYGSKTLTATVRDAYLAKFDSAGKVLWVSQVTGPGESHAYNLALDAKGNPVMAGYFDGASATFGSKTLNTTGTANKADAFVTGLTSAGAFSWSLSAGGSDADSAIGISMDTQDNIYVVGSYKGTASFGNLSLTGVSTSGTDGFVAKISAGGSFLKVTSAGGAGGRVQATDIVIDATGGTYITGVLKGTASFAGHKLTANGTTNDIFVWKTPAL